MPSFGFGCSTRVAAKRGHTAALPHCRTAAQPHGLTAARPHGRTARLHGGTAARHTTEWRHGTARRHGSTARRTAARRHRTSAPDCTSVRLYVCTAVRPHCKNCGRVTNEPEPARIVAASAAAARQYTRLRFLPTAKPAARTHSSRPLARHRAPLAAAVRTHASAYPRPLSWVSQHGPRGAQPAYTRCWTASGTAASAVPQSAVPARRGAERARTAQPAPRGPWGHRSSVLRRQWIGCNYSRAHSAPDVPAQSRRDSTISPRGEVGSGCALPAR